MFKSINNGVQAFIDYDKELVKLQQVTGESASGLAKLQSQITNLSVAYGVTLRLKKCINDPELVES